ncbi:MAG: hypothetical protein HC875_35625 [Anaerolineales bacterium]|nr:hypothetical protein [Anaerolineales bacterium]
MPAIGIPQPFIITDIKTENGATKTFSLDGSLVAKPGQFVMAWLPGHEDKPFSLAHADPIRLTIAAVGPLSQALHRLQVGDSLWLRGRWARGMSCRCRRRESSTSPWWGEGTALRRCCFWRKKPR